jgi:hypothetical protein
MGQSSVALPLLEQQLDDIDSMGHRLWQRDLVRLLRTGGRLADAQSRPFAYRNDVRNGAIAIKDRNRFSILDDAKKLAQPGLELRNANLFHDYI